MKSIYKIILGSFLLAGLQVALSSCATDGYVGSDVYYGPQPDPWFHDGPWMDGDRWHGEPRGEVSAGIYLHPPHGRR